MIFRFSILVNIFKAIAFVIATAAMLFSCSPGQRMTHLIKEHPELLKEDSVLVEDTSITKDKFITTAIPDGELKKSSADHPIEKDSAGVKTFVYHNNTNNTTYVKSECLPDTTVHKHYNIINHYTTVQHNKTHWTVYALCAAGGAVLLLLILRFLKL